MKKISWTFPRPRLINIATGGTILEIVRSESQQEQQHFDRNMKQVELTKYEFEYRGISRLMALFDIYQDLWHFLIFLVSKNSTAWSKNHDFYLVSSK